MSLGCPNPCLYEISEDRGSGNVISLGHVWASNKREALSVGRSLHGWPIGLRKAVEGHRVRSPMDIPKRDYLVLMVMDDGFSEIVLDEEVIGSCIPHEAREYIFDHWANFGPPYIPGGWRADGIGRAILVAERITSTHW